MQVQAEELRALKKLRQKYQDNEHAYDALIYHMLTQGGKNAGTVSSMIKDAVAFCRGKEGESFYENVVDILEEPKDNIYDYSSAWAKAAKNKDGMLSLDPKVVAPEVLAMQTLSRFQKTYSDQKEMHCIPPEVVSQILACLSASEIASL